MGGEVCHAKGRECGPWYEILCVKNDIIAKEADGEDASFERGLLKTWSKYPGYEDAKEMPRRPRKNRARKGLKEKSNSKPPFEDIVSKKAIKKLLMSKK